MTEKKAELTGNRTSELKSSNAPTVGAIFKTDDNHFHFLPWSWMVRTEFGADLELHFTSGLVQIKGSRDELEKVLRLISTLQLEKISTYEHITSIEYTIMES